MEKEIKLPLTCTHCADKIEKEDICHNDNQEPYCSDCYCDKYFNCDDCGNEALQENSYAYGDERICTDCRNDHYRRCEYCDELYQNNSGPCGCDESQNDDDRSCVELRDYDSTDKYCVQNQRAYSCEVECYYPSMSKFHEAVEEIAPEIGITEDGSLDSKGIEFNTPKLSGVSGDKVLKQFIATLNKYDFSVNTTCGLHIHLDGKDILGVNGAIQKLMVFFMVYEDVIISFLPLSRRDNTYCLPLSEFYHLAEIKNCYEIEGFEKIWYRQESKEERDRRKQDRHDQSRYAGINFHSLIAQGHLEIRYHSGTLNYEKIKNWIDLFVLIMDKVAQASRSHRIIQKLNLSSILKERFNLGLPKKTLSFFEMLDLPQEQRQYFLERQKKFIGDNEEEQ